MKTVDFGEKLKIIFSEPTKYRLPNEISLGPYAWRGSEEGIHSGTRQTWRGERRPNTYCTKMKSEIDYANLRQIVIVFGINHFLFRHSKNNVLELTSLYHFNRFNV